MSHLPNEGCVGTALMDTNTLSAGGGMGKQEHRASSRFSFHSKLVSHPYSFLEYTLHGPLQH